MEYLTVFSFSGTLLPVRSTKLARQLLVWFILLFGRLAYGDSGDPVWLANPVDSNWFNPANWSTGSVPGPFNAVHFGASSITEIEIPQGNAVFDMIFEPGAGAYTITALPGAAFGIEDNLVNNSGVEQNFVAAVAGPTNGGSFTFSASGNDFGTITGPVTFTQQPRGANTAGGVFFSMAGAGDATIHNLGPSVAGGFGGRADFFFNEASAEESTIINDGATVTGATGGATAFRQEKPSAGNATLIANSGTNGGGGGSFSFEGGSLGGTTRLEVFGNGYMDMSLHSGSSLSIGSIEGDGQIYLGKATLIVGTNSLSTTFSGVLHPGGPSGGNGSGFLSKIGTGTLTLTGANLYAGGTTVTQGSLVVDNATGSASGTGAVQINSGTLGGSGIVSGAVTVGTGSGSRAFLAPAHGGNKQLALTIQGAVTFNSDATYTYSFKAKRNNAKTDKVIANGVTINSGASINLSGQTQGTLKQGLVLTAISNTSANAIAGTFGNLPDGAIVNVNGNNLQASYSGGDGNDLTLTVVP